MTINSMKSLVDCTGVDLTMETGTVPDLYEKLVKAHQSLEIAYLMNLRWNGMVVTPTMARIEIAGTACVVTIPKVAQITVTNADAVTVTLISA